MSTVELEPRRPRTNGTRPGVHAARRRRLPTAWPLAALLLGYPVWWALGIAPLVWTLFSIPMVLQLLRRRPVKLPPMFWVWGLFLALVVISGLMVDVQAPDTLPVNGGPGHYIAYAIRLLNYLSVTLVMIYTGNLTEAELPRLRLIRWLGVVFVVTVAGGLLGTFAPHFGYDSPLKAVLPGSLQSIDFVQQFTHIESAQVQSVLGYPRPSAPFEYANAWGNNYSMLLVWFVIGWLLYASDRRRVVALAVLAVSVVPVVYSQNRGMWLGLVLGAVYVALRLAMQRRYGILVGLGVAAGLVGAAVVLSPLQEVVTARIATPHSNEVRGSLSLESLKVAETSPIGYGSTRSTIGSDKSATIGQSPGCPRCGNRVIGSTGQLWLLLVAQGYPGAILYLLFLFQGVVRYWKDHSVIGIGGTLVLLLGIFYSLFYTSVVSPLAITLMGMALLWRNAEARREQRAADLAAERGDGPRLFAGSST